MALPKPILRLLLIASILCAYFAYDFISEMQAAESDQEAAAESFFSARRHASQGHTNNWAVLVCSSRYWFNYRVSSFVVWNRIRWSADTFLDQQHMANALGM